jgi:regulatory protein
MPSITSIRTPTRSPGAGRASAWTAEMRLVVLDDGRRFRVDVEQVARFRLAPGGDIDDALLRNLEAQDQYRRVREQAIRLLAARPRSTADLRARLLRSGAPDGHVCTVLTDLAAAGYLDDLAFARGWIVSRMASRACGIRRLRWELREKGVPTPLVEQAIRQAFGEQDPDRVEELHARALASRRLGAYGRLAPEVQARRLAGFLERRGFAEATIARVLRTVGRNRTSDAFGG